MDFTTNRLEKLQPRGTEYTTRDSKNKGFAMRIRPNGSKTFLYIRQVSGKTAKTTLGSFPGTKLEEALVTYEELRNPPSRTQTVPKSPLLSEGWRLFHSYRRGELAILTLKQYGELIDDLIYNCGDCPLDSLSDGRLEDYLFDVDEQFKAKGNRLRAVISSLFKTLRAKRVIQCPNPVRELQYKKENAKTRKLSQQELKDTIKAVNVSDMLDDYKAAIRIALLTGQRPTEVCHIEAEEIDLEAARWILPPERTKNRREHLVPLSVRACEELKPYIHPNVQGRLLNTLCGSPVRSYNVRQALQRTQVANSITPCSLHDLRRTMAHHLNSLGVDSSLIADILNHAPQGVTAKHYIQAGLFDREAAKRAALNHWSETLVAWGL